jgi:uncharacterized protein YjiS (DUF1127 family)
MRAVPHHGPLDITRVAVNLVNSLRWKRHYESVELENLSDRSLEDIGLERLGAILLP